MRTLPPLVAGSQTWALPLADRSAVFLVETLLDAPSLTAARLSASCLTQDPPLLLWAVVHAWQRDGLQPRSLDRLVGWFLDHAVRLLHWPDNSQGLFECPAAQREAMARQVAHDLTVAELAAAVAAEESDDLADEARLLGLLSGTDRWLEIVSPGTDPKDLVPGWVGQPEVSPAARHVSRATEAARAKGGSEGVPLDVEAHREWAVQMARGWEEEIPGIPALLPPLAGRLGRLAALEKEFAQTLETEKLESLAELAAGAGHEINNPLAIIGGRSQLLLRDEECPQRQRELALIVAQVRRANEMIADMRLFSRPPEPEPEPFDLNELVARTLAEFDEQASQRAVELLRSEEAEPIEIEADPVQIGIVLHALVRNALEAIGREGIVDVSVRRTPSGVEISVADDGPGILPEERRHLFDPFYSARQAGRGLGFGLSKAWRIVTNHGGEIRVDSEPGEGSVFVVKLPRRANLPPK